MRINEYGPVLTLNMHWTRLNLPINITMNDLSIIAIGNILSSLSISGLINGDIKIGAGLTLFPSDIAYHILPRFGPSNYEGKIPYESGLTLLELLVEKYINELPLYKREEYEPFLKAYSELT